MRTVMNRLRVEPIAHFTAFLAKFEKAEPQLNVYNGSPRVHERPLIFP
jgi:hypothetical protein